VPPPPPLEPLERETAAASPTLDPAPALAAAPKKNAPPAVTICPRCAGKLTDPDGLGWCQRCGYCHSLEQDRAKVRLKPPPAAHKAKEAGLLEFVLLLFKVPSWFWTMLAGAGLVALLTMLTGQSHLKTPLARMLWCSGQIAVGMIMVLGAAFWALLVVAPADEGISTKNLFFQGRVWILTFQRLPKTRWQVWLAAWGIAAILSALIFIGNLNQWFKHLPKPAQALVPTQGITRNA
jgi:hypothetical protein